MYFIQNKELNTCRSQSISTAILSEKFFFLLFLSYKFALGKQQLYIVEQSSVTQDSYRISIEGGSKIPRQ